MKNFYLFSLLLLAGCTDNGDEMRSQLAELERQNLADSVMTNDSLAERLAEYFDHQGTPNERMRAHYILGRTYADLGEAPAALDEYHTAADYADTTATDCDYRILTRIYAQTTSLFYKQLMPNEMLEELNMMEAVAMKAKDTLSWINVDAWKYVAFDLLNEHAKARNSAMSAYSKYLDYYDETTAAECLPALIDILVKEENWDEVGHYISLYESSSRTYQELGAHGLYAFLKANYYLGINQLDSAEWYYRQELFLSQDKNEMEAAYKGLYELFQKRGITDSVAKYADLCYKTSDERFRESNANQLSLMQSLYNYSRHQRQAFENAERTHTANLRFIIAFTILVILVCIALFFLRQNNIERRKQSAKYRAAIVERNKLRTEIESLNANDYKAVMARKEQEIATLTQTIEQQSARFQQVTANDRLADFEGSSIVQAFNNKRTYHKGQTPPTDDEWETLTNQFRQDMPSAYSIMSFLSPLQLQVCILGAPGFFRG